jgi:hypothetical protein
VPHRILLEELRTIGENADDRSRNSRRWDDASGNGSECARMTLSEGGAPAFAAGFLGDGDLLWLPCE